MALVLSATHVPARSIKPGQAVTFSVVATLAGVLTDATALTLVVHGPDGSTTSVTPVHDSTGQYHGDWANPTSSPAGAWVARWKSTDPALVEDEFYVDPLDF